MQYVNNVEANRFLKNRWFKIYISSRTTKNNILPEGASSISCGKSVVLLNGHNTHIYTETRNNKIH